MDAWQRLKKTPPSPLERISYAPWADAAVAVWVKRDDLLAWAPGDPFCGNKWRKLKYNLLEAKKQGNETLLSFGGAYSNHIAALASAGRHLGFRTVGIIRGESVDNPTLERARNDGMELHFMDRTTYRVKDSDEVRQQLRQAHGPHYYIPEGGTNALALPGCAELGKEILKQAEDLPICVAVACGTGGTLAGMVMSLSRHTQVLGVSALKGYFMRDMITEHLQAFTGQEWGGWLVNEDYHHGGYAKISPELVAFMRTFQTATQIPLEPIYTGKLFFALDDLIRNGYFPAGSSVVAIHTGGLQGLDGFRGELL